MDAPASVWVFPGHGSQQPGMGRDLLRASAAAREVFAEAEEAAGLPLRTLALNGPADRLARPAALEPALAALGVAQLAVMAELGHAPRAVAGYSAGELVALHAAGVLDRAATLRIAALRGRVLERWPGRFPARMAAVYGLTPGRVEAIVGELAARGPIAVAGWNAPDHTTVVGPVLLVEAAERAAREAGGFTTRVDVAGAWHCMAAAEAAARIHEAAGEFEFRAPRIRFLSACTGAPEADPVRLRRCLAEQICTPVRWREVVDGLRSEGHTGFLEFGPGGVLRVLLERWGRAGSAVRTRCFERRGRLRLPVGTDGLAAVTDHHPDALAALLRPLSATEPVPA